MKDAPPEPALSLLGLVRAMRDCCQRQEGEMCRKLALTASQFGCLLAVPEVAGESNVNQMAEFMGLSASRASRIVDSLVRAGLLERRTMDQDRRTQLVRLTPVGQEKWRLARQLLAECEKKLLAYVPPQRSQEMQETLQVLIKAWGKGLWPAGDSPK
jgi:DNA-binding MarR family transcriptional regulator